MSASIFLMVVCAAIVRCNAYTYNVEVLEISPTPVVSYVDGTSQYEQVFNPSWIEASPGTQGVEGLVMRTQNCSATVGGPCVGCGGSGSKAR